jgi:hypothetical protein
MFFIIIGMKIACLILMNKVLISADLNFTIGKDVADSMQISIIRKS